MFNVILTTWFMMFILSKLNILISLASWKNVMIKEVKYVNGILMVTLGIVQKCLETQNTYEEFVKCCLNSFFNNWTIFEKKDAHSYWIPENYKNSLNETLRSCNFKLFPKL